MKKEDFKKCLEKKLQDQNQWQSPQEKRKNIRLDFSKGDGSSFDHDALSDANIEALLTYIVKKRLEVTELVMGKSFPYIGQDSLSQKAWVVLFDSLTLPNFSKLRVLDLSCCDLDEAAIHKLLEALRHLSQQAARDGEPQRFEKLKIYFWRKLPVAPREAFVQGLADIQADFAARYSDRPECERRYFDEISYKENFNYPERMSLLPLQSLLACNPRPSEINTTCEKYSNEDLALLASAYGRGQGQCNVDLSQRNIQNIGPIIDAFQGQVHRRLYLSFNRLGTATDFSWVRKLSGIEGLEELSLSDNKISDAFVRELCKVLPQVTKLNDLDLSENAFGDAGAMALADVLPQLVHLRRLKLDKNAISIETSVAILAVLPGPLEKIDMGNGYHEPLKLNQAGALELARYLVRHYRGTNPLRLDFEVTFANDVDRTLAFLIQRFMEGLEPSWRRDEYDIPTLDRKEGYFTLKHRLAQFDTSFVVRQEEFDGWGKEDGVSNESGQETKSSDDDESNQGDENSIGKKSLTFEDLQKPIELPPDLFSDEDSERSIATLADLKRRWDEMGASDESGDELNEDDDAVTSLNDSDANEALGSSTDDTEDSEESANAATSEKRRRTTSRHRFIGGGAQKRQRRASFGEVNLDDDEAVQLDL